MVKYFSIFSLVMFFGSCAELAGLLDQPSPSNRHEMMAKEICDCSSDFLNLVEKMNAYSQSGNKTAMKNILPKLQSELPVYQNCMERVEERYSDLKGKNHENLSGAALEKVCPRLNKMMGK